VRATIWKSLWLRVSTATFILLTISSTGITVGSTLVRQRHHTQERAEPSGDRAEATAAPSAVQAPHEHRSDDPDSAAVEATAAPSAVQAPHEHRSDDPDSAAVLLAARDDSRGSALT